MLGRHRRKALLLSPVSPRTLTLSLPCSFSRSLEDAREWEAGVLDGSLALGVLNGSLTLGVLYRFTVAGRLAGCWAAD